MAGEADLDRVYRISYAFEKGARVVKIVRESGIWKNIIKRDLRPSVG
jgi:hypothetical protein